MSKLLHPWCAAWLEAVGSFLLIAQTCSFFVCFFGGQGEAKLSWAQQWTSPLMSARMRPLHAASPHVTKAHIPWQQEFRNGQTLSWPRELQWEGVPQSLPQGWPQSLGCLAAMLPPLGGAPLPARGMMALGFCRAQVWCSFLDVFHKMSVRPGLQATRYMLVKQVCKYNYLLRIFVFANPRSYYWGSWL